MKVLVTGDKKFCRTFVKKLGTRYRVIFLGRDDLDITNTLEVEKKILDVYPDIVIHCLALDDIEACERDKAMAFQINSYGAQNVAIASSMCEAKLVYISTSHVFSGRLNRPYRESDELQPVNVYGLSKLLAENFIKEINRKFFIVRTGWLYGPGRDSLIGKLIETSKQEKTVELPGDRYDTPTFIGDLAHIIGRLMTTDFYGTYHITNSGYCSLYSWGLEVVRALKLNVNIKEVTLEHQSGLVRIPEYTVLDNNLVANKLGIRPRGWRKALNSYLVDYLIYNSINSVS
ncbi:SDR family oxidoreductase [Halothermothrix orenii]|uniref:dTDP-4-dehydrorhamnose reductase n=1 Tax=Halothermothrix orenii (strain H 168 / OCM 544 / DSM 9562) TaxID=373903 RepID=B8CYW5_HALOH|nr:NAD(P)-dependent oxidoreductase [Halothermothrix orenii]ACL70484.1 dTDP-4-dehydrorhamnose reductase [Halothermothrix orenii H 168]